MSQKENMETIEKALRACRDNHLVMGGVWVVFVGVFIELLSITQKSQPIDQYRASLRCSRLSNRQMKQFLLTVNVRAARMQHP